jgi:hypothetical protein
MRELWIANTSTYTHITAEHKSAPSVMIIKAWIAAIAVGAGQVAMDGKS